MKSFSFWCRLLSILWTLAVYRVDALLFSRAYLAPLRGLRSLYCFRAQRRLNACSDGERVRLCLEALGPLFVKFGQVLSTRRDVLPQALADELARLQDQVPPFSGEEAIQRIEKAYGCPLGQVFKTFSKTPLASASIAQVHAGCLHSGEHVVVKVVRPHLKKRVKRDIDFFYFIARQLVRCVPRSRRFRPKAVVGEFERHLFDELNLMQEAASASQLKRNFEHQTILKVPQIYWEYTSEEVMMMEAISATSLKNHDSPQWAGVDKKRLAELGVEIFFTQVFRDRFFHADMHPGNIFADLTHPQQPTYVAVDFGIMGVLNSDDQFYLAANFLAFFNRDYHQVAQLHIRSGWVNPNTRVDVLERAIRTVCEPIFERPLKEISFGKTLLRLFQTAQQFDMEIQPQLLLLQKTLLNIEGLGRQLYPELDLWHTAKPFLERWMKERIGFRSIRRTLHEKLPLWSQQWSEIPSLVYENLQKKSTPVERKYKASKKGISFIARLGLIACSGLLVTMAGFTAFQLPWLVWLQQLSAFPGTMLVLGVIGLYLGLFKVTEKESRDE